MQAGSREREEEKEEGEEWCYEVGRKVGGGEENEDKRKGGRGRCAGRK